MIVRLQFKTFYVCTAIVLIVGAVAGGLIRVAGNRESESNALLKHSADVANSLNEFSTAFDDCESDSRSMINFGHSDGDLPTCRAKVIETFERLKSLTKDNASQTTNLDFLDYSIHQRFKDVDRLVYAYQTGGTAAVLAIVQTGTTLANSRQVNSARGFVQKEESRLLIQRGASVEKSRQNLSYLIQAVFFLFIVSIVVSLIVLYCKIKTQEIEENKFRDLYVKAVKESKNAVLDDSEFTDIMEKVKIFLKQKAEVKSDVQ